MIAALVAIVGFGQANAGTIAGGSYVSPTKVRVELIGFADGDSRQGPVYGANGKPLQTARAKEYAIYAQEPGYLKTGAPQPATRRWLVIFRILGPDDLTRQVSFGDSLNASMMAYLKADPKTGRRDQAIMANAYRPASGTVMNIPFVMPTGPYRKIADFEEDGMTFDEGFFISLKKSKLDGFAATEQESRAYTMDGYRGTALVPMSFKGMDFRWDDSGPQTSPNPTGLTGDRSALAFETGVENGSLRLQLYGRLPKAKSRTFQLYARPTLSFHMRLRLPALK